MDSAPLDPPLRLGREGSDRAANNIGMPIARVEVFLLEFPLPHRREFSTGGGDTRGASLVRIEDADGAVGWGETYPLPAGTAKLAAVGRLLLGRDPSAAIANQRLIGDAANGDGFATGALSIALDDLRARQAGVPAHVLYGGARRNRVRAYASSEGYVPGMSAFEAWRAEADRVVETGFTGFKLRIGRDPIRDDLDAMTRLRAAFPALELMADGNAAYTFRQAVDVARHLAELGFRWFEEPLPTTDYVGYERLRAVLPLTLAGGESIQDRGAARDLIDRAGVDIIQPDVSICGGIGEALWIADLARLNGIETYPHACNGAINLAASLHALAALPDPNRLLADAPLLEHDFGPNPARTDLFATPLRFVDGVFDVPTGPGLGVDVDEGFVRRRAVEFIAAQ